MVLKFPLVLNYQTSNLETILRALRAIAAAREDWAYEYASISPSLLAFYIRCVPG